MRILCVHNWNQFPLDCVCKQVSVPLLSKEDKSNFDNFNIHLIVSYAQNISLIFYVEDGSHARLWVVTSVLCLHYRPETVHCSTKNTYTSEKLSLHYNSLCWRKEKLSSKAVGSFVSTLTMYCQMTLLPYRAELFLLITRNVMQRTSCSISCTAWEFPYWKINHPAEELCEDSYFRGVRFSVPQCTVSGL